MNDAKETDVRRRGYLLLEISIGGAMAAVVLFGMLSFVASGRSKNVAASRSITANQLVNEALDRTRALGYPPAGEPLVTVEAAGGRYRRTITTNSTGCPETRGTFSLPCTNVVATVAFDVIDNGTVREKSMTAALRMYE